MNGRAGPPSGPESAANSVQRAFQAHFFDPRLAHGHGACGVHLALETGQVMKAQRALIAQWQPHRHVGATLIDQAFPRCVPQGQANALADAVGVHIQSPNFTGGVGRFG